MSTQPKPKLPYRAKYVVASWFIIIGILWTYVIWVIASSGILNLETIIAAIVVTMGYAGFTVYYTISQIKKPDTAKAKKSTDN